MPSIIVQFKAQALQAAKTATEAISRAAKQARADFQAARANRSSAKSTRPDPTRNDPATVRASGDATKAGSAFYKRTVDDEDGDGIGEAAHGLRHMSHRVRHAARLAEELGNTDSAAGGLLTVASTVARFVPGGAVVAGLIAAVSQVVLPEIEKARKIEEENWKAYLHNEVKDALERADLEARAKRDYQFREQQEARAAQALHDEQTRARAIPGWHPRSSRLLGF